MISQDISTALALAGVSRRRFMASMLGGMAALASLDSASIGHIADDFCGSGKSKWHRAHGKLLVRYYRMPMVNEFWSREIIELPENGIRIVELSVRRHESKTTGATPIEWKLARGPESTILHQLFHPLWDFTWRAGMEGGLVATGLELQIYTRQAAKAVPVEIGGVIVGVEI